MRPFKWEGGACYKWSNSIIHISRIERFLSLATTGLAQFQSEPRGKGSVESLLEGRELELQVRLLVPSLIKPRPHPL